MKYKFSDFFTEKSLAILNIVFFIFYMYELNYCIAQLKYDFKLIAAVNFVSLLFFIFITTNIITILNKYSSAKYKMLDTIEERYKFLITLSEYDNVSDILNLALKELNRYADIDEISFLSIMKGDNISNTVSIDSTGNIDSDERIIEDNNIVSSSEIKNGNMLHLGKDGTCILILFFASDFIRSGSLTVSYKAKSVNPDMKDLLEKSAKLIIPSLKSAKFYECSIRDPLTNALNRTVLKYNIEHLIKNSRRYNGIFSLFLLDLDYFKKINDTYGHITGDLVIKNTASTIKKCIRETDSLYRYGGEEFLVILTETPLEAARQATGRILASIESSDILTADSRHTINITASIGLVEFNPNKHIDYISIIEDCDDKLYNAKFSGRNRVEY